MEWSVMTGIGARIGGGAREGNFWALQLRWGRVLTAPRGSGVLRGSLEYAFELVPALVMAQSNTVFGAGLNPIMLQYNFGGNGSGGRVFPFLQVGSGMLFSTDDIPAGTAQFNFTPQGGAGIYWMGADRPSIVFGVRYHHISNAGRVRPNPGHNAIYIYGGLAWWR